MVLICKLDSDRLFSSLHLKLSIQRINSGLGHGSLGVPDESTAKLGCVVVFLPDNVDSGDFSVRREELANEVFV
jgi:hypothetical protein